MRYLQGRDFIADALTDSHVDGEIHPPGRPLPGSNSDCAGDPDKSVFELEHRVIRVDGTLGSIFSRAIPIFDAEGSTVEWFGTARDVTRRKAQEAALPQRDRWSTNAVWRSLRMPSARWLHIWLRDRPMATSRVAGVPAKTRWRTRSTPSSSNSGSIHALSSPRACKQGSDRIETSSHDGSWRGCASDLEAPEIAGREVLDSGRPTRVRE